MLANSNALQCSTIYSSGISFGTLTNATFGGLGGEDDLSLTNDSYEAVALSVGKNDYNTEYEGSLSGSGSLTKIGEGRLILEGYNSYTGGTIINHGILGAYKTFSLPQFNSLGQVVVNDGGTLRLYVGDSNNRWTSTNIDTLLDNATFNSGSMLSIYIAQSGGSFIMDKSIRGDLGVSCDRGNTTLTLSAENTYTGSTYVYGGTMNITGSLANNGSDKVFVATWNPDVVPYSGSNDEPYATIIRKIGAGESFAGYGSTSIGDQSLPDWLDWSFKTSADILDGTNTGGDKYLSMQWSMGSTFTPPPIIPGPLLRFSATSGRRVSDILILSGMADEEGYVDQFTLQMSYCVDALPDGAEAEAALAAAGCITLNCSDLTEFMGVGVTPDGMLGHYGIDLESHTIWAVINSNGSFCVMASSLPVPEPGTLVLLVIAALALIARRKRG